MEHTFRIELISSCRTSFFQQREVMDRPAPRSSHSSLTSAYVRIGPKFILTTKYKEDRLIQWFSQTLGKEGIFKHCSFPSQSVTELITTIQSPRLNGKAAPESPPAARGLEQQPGQRSSTALGLHQGKELSSRRELCLALRPAELHHV